MAHVRERAWHTGVATSFTVNKPPGTVAQDMMFAFQVADLGAQTDLITPTGGATWQLLYGSGTFQGRRFLHKIWWKVAGSAEPASYGFAKGNGADGVAVVLSVADAETTTPQFLVEHVDSLGSIVTKGVGSGPALDIRWAAALPDGEALTWEADPTWEVQASLNSDVYASGWLGTRELGAGETSPDMTLSTSFAWIIGGVTIRVASSVTGPTQKTGADSAALSEMVSRAVLLDRTDSAAVIDLAQAGPSAADGAGFTESGTVSAAAAVADIASQTESSTVTADADRTEVAGLADVAALQVVLARDDAAALAEQAHIGLATADVAELGETSSREEIFGPVTFDLTAAVEAASVSAQSDSDETLAFAESAHVDVLRTAADAGALNEEATAGPSADETAAVGEAASVTVLLDRTDTAAVTDTGTSSQPTSASDSAALIETSLVVEVGRAITGVDGPRRQWGVSSARRQWSADPPRRTWSASTHT
ncbi:hypothetical protein [Nonomuraea sp. LPB2021202275-12-8]|uniref:hypothetical protein n=1 Tax=Nonomuraea sp. LPB2021202275-12-8 TaxID=3120159 RepID=UPI00300D3066